LSELDKRTCYLVQNKINNIIFQAQAGLLDQETQPPIVMHQQQNYFHPILSTVLPQTSPQQ
jgi:hypothetical protein